MIQSSETLHKKVWTAKESSKHLCVETKTINPEVYNQ